MSAKRLSILFAVILPLCTSISFAASSPVLLQGCAWEDNIDVFISGDLRVEDSQLAVSKQTAEVIDGGRLADKGVTIRTTVLLDISTSMPQSMRPRVKDYIDYYIENLGDNEELRIETFASSYEKVSGITGLYI